MRKVSLLWHLALVVGVMLTAARLTGATLTLTVDVPKTAYIQWLNNSTDAMTNVNGDNTVAMNPYVGGAMTQLTQPANKTTYLGIMCNALTGYDVTMTALNTGATASTGRLVITGGAPLTYTATLAKVAASFTAGATAAPSLDLTGASVSATAVFAASTDLPMLAVSPNVWQMTFSLPVISSVADGLIMAGTYTGGVTATVALK